MSGSGYRPQPAGSEVIAAPRRGSDVLGRIEPIIGKGLVAPDVDARFRRVILDDIERRGPIFQAMRRALADER